MQKENFDYMNIRFTLERLDNITMSGIVSIIFEISKQYFFSINDQVELFMFGK